MTQSLADVEQENEGLTREELEKIKKERLERLEECKPFKELINSPSWEKVKSTLEKDIVRNLHFSKDSEYYHLCWGIKMTIERIEARAKAVDELIQELSKQEVE